MSINMKKIIILILCTVLQLSEGGLAFAFYCGNKIIDEGLSKGEVRRWCGEPTFQDRREEDRIEKGDNEKEDIVLRVTVDEWMYNFGPDKFIQVLLFETGLLREIRAGEYGWSLSQEGKNDCVASTLLLGASKSDIIVKCGPPHKKDSWQKSYRRDTGSASNPRLVQTFEEWTYKTADGKGLVFKFDGGKLVNVNTIE